MQGVTTDGEEYSRWRGSIREIEKLVADTRAGTLKPGLHNDRSVPGLHVDLRKGAAWLLRFTSPEKRNAAGKPQVRDMGLGSLYLPSVGLKAGLGPAEARGKARTARQLVSTGVDPMEHEKQAQQKKALDEANTKTFEFCAESFPQTV